MVCNTEMLTWKFKRTGKGLEIYMQSDHLETFFNHLCSPTHIDSHPSWEGITGNRLTQNISDIPMILNSWGGPLIQLDGNGHQRANCSMLRAKGLKKGVTFIIQGLHSEAVVEDWRKGVNAGVKELCRQYLTPKDVEFEITTSEISHSYLEKAK